MKILRSSCKPRTRNWRRFAQNGKNRKMKKSGRTYQTFSFKFSEGCRPNALEMAQRCEAFVGEPRFHRTKPRFILIGWRNPDLLNSVTSPPLGVTALGIGRSEEMNSSWLNAWLEEEPAKQNTRE